MKKKYLFLIACLTGLLLALAWPTKGFTPLVFVAWIPLLWVQDRISRDTQRRFCRLAGFLYSFVPFLIFNLITTYWVFNVAAPMVVGYLFEAFVMAIFFQLFHSISKRTAAKTKGLLFIGIWLTYEYLQMQWELSFPWLNMGNVFSEHPQWIQWYEYTGSFGGSLWVLFANVLGLHLVQIIDKHNGAAAKGKRNLLIHSSAYLLSIAIPLLISYSIGWAYEEETQQHAHVIVLQPNIDPLSEQFNLPPEQITYQMCMQAKRLIDSQTDFILSPESSIQESPWQDQLSQSYCLNIIEEFLHRNPHVEWLAGLSLRRRVAADSDSKAKRQYYLDSTISYEYCNSAIMLPYRRNDQIIHKIKLTPFVEQMPYSALFAPVEELALDLGGITGSLGVDSVRASIYSPKKQFRILPIICYESLYGEFIGEAVCQGADFIFIMTNDGWFGNTQGHLQHCSYARLRAVEMRRCIARAANTGTSCFIDAKGNISQKTPYWEATAIKASLPAQTKITYYAKYGDYIAKAALWLTAATVLFLLISTLWHKNKKR